MAKKCSESDFRAKEDPPIVILADDFIDTFKKVDSTFPSVLMTVANVPLLEYMIENVLKSDYRDVYLFCTYAHEVQNYIKEKKLDKMANLNLTVLKNVKCKSLGDALRHIDSIACIQSNFILIRGNAFTNIDLRHFYSVHRSKVKKDQCTAMTMLMKDVGSILGSQLRDQACVLFSDTDGMLIDAKKFSQTEKTVRIETKFFLTNREVQIRSNSIDSHIYICSPKIIALFAENSDFQTMDDFLASILGNELVEDCHIYLELLSTMDYALPIVSWRAFDIASRDILQRLSYPLVPDALRSTKNSIQLLGNSYKHQTSILDSTCTIRPFSMIGKNSRIGKRSSVTKSIIGDNCEIGDNVHIENSYIMSNVKIEDNVKIQESFIYDNSHLQKNVEVDGCIVSKATTLKADKNYSDSIIREKGGIQCTPMQGCEEQEEVVFFKRDNNVPEIGLDIEDDDSVFSDNNDGASDDHPDSDFNDDDMDVTSDDFTHFFHEVSKSLLHAYHDQIEITNLILEINSSRFAYNVNLRDLTFYVVKAIFSLPDHKSIKNQGSTTDSYLSILKHVVEYCHPIFINYIKREEARSECLRAIQLTAAKSQEFVSCLPYLLHRFYDKDLLSEDSILDWYKGIDDELEETACLKKTLQPFIKWLMEAEEDSSDDDDDDDD